MSNGVASLDRSALVAYGSETGNAVDCSEELGRALERLHFATTVSALDHVSPASLLTVCLQVCLD